MRRLLVISLLFASASAFGETRPSIENLVATASQKKVSVRFVLAGAAKNGEMVEALQSGLPTSFTYDIQIYRDRPKWFNEGVGRVRIDVICTFNSLTREYLLNYRRDRHLVRSETFTDLVALMQRMTVIDEPDLFDIGDRKPYKLKIRVKADLMREWLMHVIPWEVSTRWREARVRVAEAAAP